MQALMIYQVMESVSLQGTALVPASK